MNLAFPALLILLIALPGIIARYSFRLAPGDRPPRQMQPVAEEIALSLVVAAVVHAVLIAAANLFFTPVDMPAVFRLLLGRFGERDAFLESTIAAVTDHPVAVSAYFLSSFVAASLLGALFHRALQFIRPSAVGAAIYRRLIHPSWHDSLAESLNAGEVIVISCVMGVGGGIVYRGILDGMSFARSGEVFALDVWNAERMPLIGIESFRDVPSRHVILRYSDISALEVLAVQVEGVSVEAEGDESGSTLR